MPEETTINVTSMIDIANPNIVEVEVRDDGEVMWVNVDGICRLRVSRIQQMITIADYRVDKN